MSNRFLAVGFVGVMALASDGLATPQVGARLPEFEAVDLTGQRHRSQELVGRPTLVIAATDVDADVPMRAWGAATDRRLPPGAGRVVILAFDLAFFIPSATARNMARDRSPPSLWSNSWFDSTGRLRVAAGLPESEVPFAFVLDPSGRIVASAHSAVDAPEAEAIWRALGSAAP
jgi:hypothetical protein